MLTKRTQKKNLVVWSNKYVWLTASKRVVTHAASQEILNLFSIVDIRDLSLEPATGLYHKPTESNPRRICLFI